MKIEEVAYQKAIQVLDLCSTPHGFYAAHPGYQMVFGRDSMISSLGASLEREHFQKSFKESLLTLSKYQSPLGQIPNAVDLFGKPPHHVDYQSIDSTLWFIIGNHIYKSKYVDNELSKSQEPAIKKALTWLSYQDMGEDGMLEQLPTTDWQDAFPHRYGHTINTQALYHKVLLLSGDFSSAEKLKNTVNKNKDCSLWNGKFYLPWRWKNHGIYHEKGEWFDSLGNLLAILFDVADKKQALQILEYIHKNKINSPYPMKSIFPPIKPKTKDWQDYFLNCEAGRPNNYLNGGIWTYIGGFYVLSLIKLGLHTEAEKQLRKFAEANLLSNPPFAEWLHGLTGKPSKLGGNQAWNAGMYILAYKSLEENKVLI